MHRPHIKKFTTAVITAALALSLTACGGAGPDAPTRLIKRVTDGAEATVTTNGSNLSISNLLLVATEDGSAVVVGTIVNYKDEADALLGISAGGTSATLTSPVFAGSASLPVRSSSATSNSSNPPEA